MDLFYLGDVLRGLNCSPTLKTIEELGGTKKKGEKFIKLEEFYPVYSKVKASLKDMGSFEDFVECCKLYDKQENGTMMLGELEHILLNLGKMRFDIWNKKWPFNFNGYSIISDQNCITFGT